MKQDEIKLGSVETSELLINELYLELRRKVNDWSRITHQTAQARMGYVGQHLVSVATGFPGGKSGARGDDLIHDDGSPGEVKTCYRVDQLGQCGNCGAVVASTELSCASCASTDVVRKDDSKWLISVRNDDEFDEICEPKYYYMVLFEFLDLQKPTEIQASIWRVDPNAPGFVLCMVDYYKNVKSKSRSGAPFNMWPYSLKFALMKPRLIYRCVIDENDRIDTQLFPGRDSELIHAISPMTDHSRTRVPDDAWRALSNTLGESSYVSKKHLFGVVDRMIAAGQITNDNLCDILAYHYYQPTVDPHVLTLPAALKPIAKKALTI